MGLNFAYEIKLQFFIDKSDPIIPFQIKSLVKKFDYYEKFHPVFEANLLMAARWMLPIFKNKHNIYCNLKLTQKLFTKGQTEGDSLESVSESILFDHVFIPFFTPNSFSNIINKEEVAIVGDETEEDKSPGYKEMVCTLYSLEGLIGNKSTLNAVLTNGEAGVDPGTALRYMFENISFKEIIVDKPDNLSKYKAIIIPQHNIATAIKDLQVRYGIYIGGVSVFFDPPILYILNKFTSVHDFKEETVHNNIFHIIADPSRAGGLTEATYLENKDLEYTLAAVPQKNDEDVYTAELYGNYFAFTNYALAKRTISFTNGEFTEFNRPILTIKSPSDKHIMTGEKISVEYDELNNVWNMAAFAKTMSPHITLHFPTIQGVSYDTFHPNSSFLLKFNDDLEKDREIGGKYGIIKGALKFTKVSQESDQYDLSAHNILLIKDYE
jgi:hypothetical protein